MTLTELEDELRRMRASVSTQADREAELQPALHRDRAPQGSYVIAHRFSSNPAAPGRVRRLWHVAKGIRRHEAAVPWPAV